MDDLHQRMGHILPTAARKLVKDGHVTRLHLDMSSKASFCEVCAKTKFTHKPVPKECGGPHMMNLSEKVHSDVWGPSNTQSLDGKEYFISVTDDQM